MVVMVVVSGVGGGSDGGGVGSGGVVVIPPHIKTKGWREIPITITNKLKLNRDKLNDVLLGRGFMYLTGVCLKR